MSDIFHLSMSPWELLVRGTVMYWFLLLLFRFVLRRDTGSAGVPDLLFVVLLGDAAQNGMIGSGETVSDALLLITVLALWNYSLDTLGYYVPLIARLNDPPSIPMIRNGRILMRNLRREHMTIDELNAGLRGEGLDSLDKVKHVFLEPDGKLSVIKR